MRILGISLNLGQRNNVNFGRFADENARKVVREALTEKDPSYVASMQPCYDGAFKRIEDCDFFEAYTAEDETVKGKFDDEFVKQNTADTTVYKQRAIKGKIEVLEQYGELDDLSKLENAEEVADYIGDIYKLLAGEDLSLRWHSENPHGDRSASEARSREMLEGLAK